MKKDVKGSGISISFQILTIHMYSHSFGFLCPIEL